MPRCHKFILKSSADKYVSSSLFKDIELIWYVCAFANTRLGLASTTSSEGLNTGTRNDVTSSGFLGTPWSSRRLKLDGA